MKFHPIVPLVFLVTFSGVLIWRSGEDEQRKPAPTTMAALALSSAIAEPPPTPRPPTRLTAETAPWAHPQVMHTLRVAVMSQDATVWHKALAQAQPVLATDRDVQLQVGWMLTGRGDPLDGLAWHLLACQHCTLADERLGHGCAAKGLCDPNLELIDVYRRDFGEQMTAEALARMEEIQAAIASGASLEPFTDLDQRKFPLPDEDECVQLRTPTPECPPDEILRQTQEAFERREAQ